MSHKVVQPQPAPHHNRLIDGLALIVIGIFVLLANATANEIFGLLVLPAVGIVMLLWAVQSREYALLIPGSIITGLGVGVVLIERVLTLSEDAAAGVILFSLAGGFLAISLLSPMFGQRRLSWPLIPAAIIGGIGLMLLVGGMMLEVLVLVNAIWPVALIAAGVVVLFWSRRAAK